MTLSHQTPRLLLVVDVVAGAIERVGAACGAAPVAAVVIRVGNTRDGRILAAGLVDAVRHHGAIALIEDDVDVARSVSADGVHLSASTDIEERYGAARTRLGRDAIIGVDVGWSRHSAMTTAEEGADYVAFGVARDEAQAENIRDARLDLVAWWAEIFEPPCVALDVGTPQEARDLAEAGADFIAISIAPGRSPAEVGERVGAMAAALLQASEVDREAQTLP